MATQTLDSDAYNTTGWLFHIVLDGDATNTHNQTLTLDLTTTAGSIRLPNGVNVLVSQTQQVPLLISLAWHIEEGTIPSPFEHRTYAEDLRDCQRYYFHTYRHGLDVGATGSDNGGTN